MACLRKQFVSYISEKEKKNMGMGERGKQLLCVSQVPLVIVGQHRYYVRVVCEWWRWRRYL